MQCTARFSAQRASMRCSFSQPQRSCGLAPLPRRSVQVRAVAGHFKVFKVAKLDLPQQSEPNQQPNFEVRAIRTMRVKLKGAWGAIRAPAIGALMRRMTQPPLALPPFIRAPGQRAGR